VKTLAALVKMLWTGECKYISSKFLKSVVGEQDNLFGGMEQQDSHEFLIMLIDWLQSDLQTISMVSCYQSSRNLKVKFFLSLAKQSRESTNIGKGMA
jgi:ubiquitin C-terminal hydrolase